MDEIDGSTHSSLIIALFEEGQIILALPSSIITRYEDEGFAARGKRVSTVRGGKPALREIWPFEA